MRGKGKGERRTQGEGKGQAQRVPFAVVLLPLSSSKGFTLLEILIAMSILGVITAIIASSLHMGILSWERGEAATEKYQHLRILTDEISQQIKSIYPYKVPKGNNAKPQLIFLGDEHDLGFMTTLVYKGSKEERGGFQFVYYELDKDRGLIKREKIVFSGDISIKDLGDPIELDPQVSQLKLEYYEKGKSKEDPASGRWVNTWQGASKDRLPKAIRITLGFRPKRQSGSSSRPSDELTLTIPVFAEPKLNAFSVNPTIARSNITSPGINPPNLPLPPSTEYERP